VGVWREDVNSICSDGIDMSLSFPTLVSVINYFDSYQQMVTSSYNNNILLFLDQPIFDNQNDSWKFHNETWKKTYGHTYVKGEIQLTENIDGWNS
jgi:hypothetical protein